MGKYEPLTHYLENRSGEIWEAKFADVEQILGFPLPDSAHKYPAWWANQEQGHSQTKGWREAGWETGQVDLSAKKVRFRRSMASAHTANAKDDRAREALWLRAHRISGIDDRESLIEAALEALIRREAGRQLAEMGGTMPEFAVPQRERPTW